MLKEFKTFAMRGNVVDMAIGIIIGAAFGKIVSSLVADVIMPPVGMLLGNVNFTNLFVSLSGGSYASLDAARAAGAATINYGIFINTIVDFVLVAFVMFLLVKGMNRMQKAETPAAPATKSCPECLSEIPLGAKRCAHCAVVMATA
ncbi:MAG: large conductance mechanosensitive channel protein MscL [candidate division Zixibacteria bacterium]|nr:large conductance mechanosensitive channel protein MscL [candidate division Zixibacteria bacterium]